MYVHYCQVLLIIFAISVSIVIGNRICNSRNFACRDGLNCLTDNEVCNGQADCSDRSDEDPSLCDNYRRQNCRGDEFQCHIGGCIPRQQVCDGFANCDDASDEGGLCRPTPKPYTRCREPPCHDPNAARRRRRRQYSDKGYELEDDELPNGPPGQRKKNNRGRPGNKPIPPGHRPDKPGNGHGRPNPGQQGWENQGGTNEQINQGNGCQLPSKPKRGHMEIAGCDQDHDNPVCYNQRGRVPYGTLVSFSCNRGYYLHGQDRTVCQRGGHWSQPTPICVSDSEPEGPPRPHTNAPTRPQTSSPTRPTGRPSTGGTIMACPPLHPSKGVQIECVHNTTFQISSCENTVRPGTEATYSCNNYYTPSNKLPVHYRTCKDDGTWTGSGSFTCQAECGKSDIPKKPLITYGQPTTRGQWPWHVALYLQSEGKWKYICGGSLISENAVITAGHCVTEPGKTTTRITSSVKVYMGKYYRAMEQNDENVQSREVSAIYLHSSYNPQSFDSDIAILTFKEDVTLTYFVRPVCIPRSLQTLVEDVQLAENNVGTVVGWGFLETEELADELKMAEMPVVSAQTCADSFKQFFQAVTRSTTYCAGYRNGTSVCNGDSGGGMVFANHEGSSTSWTLQGIVSLGVPKANLVCDNMHYALFTRVGRYADWIVRILIKIEAESRKK